MTMTLVHTKVTSDRFALSGSFQQHLAARNYSAWIAGGNLYCDVDEVEGTKFKEVYMNCRTQSWFARHKSSGEIRVIGSACKLRWCTLCAEAKKTYITHQIADWIKNSKWHRFVTFTLKHNDDDLTSQIERLYDCFRKLKRSKIWKSGAKRGVWFFQVKRSKNSNQWHPHIHCVISGPWFDYKKLRKTWLSITGDSSVVGIHPVKDPDGCAFEVARYAASPANLETNDRDDFYEIYQSMKSRRICGTWGLKDVVRLTPPKAEDKGEWENIGTWSEVQKLQNSDSRAQAIIKAWATHEPLEAGIELHPAIKPGKTMQEIYRDYAISEYNPTFFD